MSKITLRKTGVGSAPISRRRLAGVARIGWPCVVGLCCLVTLGCAGGSGLTPRQASILTTQPADVLAGATSLLVAVTGSGFNAGTVIEVDGEPRQTTYRSPTAVSFLLAPADVAVAGRLALTAADEQSRTSAIYGFYVDNPSPSISSLSPAQAGAGLSSLDLLIGGSGFVTTSQVEVNGAPRPTGYVDPSHLRATLTSEDLHAVRQLSVAAQNPEPGGGLSQPSTFPVVSPPPATINVQSFGAIGSSYWTTGSIVAGSNALRTGTPWDSSVAGEGIQVLHAGIPVTLASPSAPIVLPVSDLLTPTAQAVPAGSGTCDYAVAALDAHGGETAAGPVATIATSSSSLGPTTWQNQIQWYGVDGADGYALYGRCDGAAWHLVTLEDLPESDIFWTGRTAVRPGALLAPLHSNGFLYRAAPIRFCSPLQIEPGVQVVTPSPVLGLTVGQLFDVDWGTAEEEVVSVISVSADHRTFTAAFGHQHPFNVSFRGMTGDTEPRWALRPGGTIDDGAVVWTNVPFTVYDIGEPMVGPSGPAFDVPATVSQTPPSVALADTLATTIASIDSSRLELTLGSSAQSSVSAAQVLHDDLGAIQSAFQAAASATLEYQLFPGSQDAISAPVIEIPSGQYPIDAAISPPIGAFSVQGDDGAIIVQTAAMADVLKAQVSGGFRAEVDGLTFRGGRSSIWLGGPDVDGSTVLLSRDTFLSSLDYAIFTVGLEVSGQRFNDIHLSLELDVEESLAYGCRRWVFTSSDLTTLNDNWFEMSPANAEANPGIITLAGGVMHVDNGTYIPGLLPFGAHWVDDFGESFYSDGVRWGAEGAGGIPVLYDFENEYSSAAGGIGARNYSTGTAWDTVVSITNGELAGGPAEVAGTPSAPVLGLVDCVTSCPALLNITGNYYAAFNNVFVANPTGLDLDFAFTVSPLDVPGGFLTHNEVHYVVDNNDASGSLGTPAFPSVPAQMVPYLPNPVAATVPAAGNWASGQSFVVGGAQAYVADVTGKAAPEWQAAHHYSSGAVVGLAALGSVYVAAAGGLSGKGAPGFDGCTSYGCTVIDGSVDWRYYGPAAHFAAVGSHN